MQKVVNQSIIKNCSFINGEWLESTSYFEVINPADLSEIALVCEVQTEQVVRAINAASIAQTSWQDRSPSERANLLARWQKLIRGNIQDLSRLMTLEQGKPLSESAIEIAHAADYIQIYSEVSQKMFFPKMIEAPEGQRAKVTQRPIGVVSAITPWNFPCSMVLRKAAAALAAGCCVVLKPSELTPLTCLALAVLSQQAGIPKGVFNVVVGTNAQAIGELLSQHPMVAKLSFTGSTGTGKKLLAQCAQGVKRVSMELGGNAPFIVFDDADLDSAVEGAIASKYRNAGQTCVSANRFLVHEDVLESFKQRLIEQVKSLVIGNGLAPSTTIGPLINQAAVEKMNKLQQEAIAQGASICYQSKCDTSRGYYYPPTILENVQSTQTIFGQEIFGPLVCLTSFENEVQAIQLANQTIMGLCAYFYTADTDRQRRLSQKLQFGMVAINQAKLSNPAAPFGGFKQSGMGREGGCYGVEDYLDYQYVCEPHTF